MNDFNTSISSAIRRFEWVNTIISDARALGRRMIQVRRPDGQYRDTPAAPQGKPQHAIANLDELLPLI